MQANQGPGLSGGNAFAAGAAVKQSAAFVLAILAADGDVALKAQTVILALFVGTETLLKLAHRLPPTKKWKMNSTKTIILQAGTVCQLFGDITKKQTSPDIG
jgi:hypothetical protein